MQNSHVDVETEVVGGMEEIVANIKVEEKRVQISRTCRVLEF